MGILLTTFFNQTVKNRFGGKAENTSEKTQNPESIRVDLLTRIEEGTLDICLTFNGKAFEKIFNIGCNAERVGEGADPNP